MSATGNVLRHRSVLLLGLLITSGILAGCGGQESEEQALSRQEALEQEFEESMTGATLEGFFTVLGSETQELRPEKYTIEKVSKLGGNYWTFHARIQYGDHDLTLPVPVEVLWAGDTPVVTLTDAEIPGLGTFTARVLFYRSQYAGTWSHGDTRGSQFGRIVKQNEAAELPKEHGGYLAKR